MPFHAIWHGAGCIYHHRIDARFGEAAFHSRSATRNHRSPRQFTIMKLFLLILFFSLGAALAQKSEYLDVPTKEHRASLSTLDRQQFLSTSNVQRIVVLPSTRWQVSGIGPDFYIQQFKQAFRSSVAIIEPSEELESMIAWENAGDASRRSRIRWSGAYFLTANGDFLTFGEIAEGFVFRTRNTVGVIVTKMPEGGASNGNDGLQPIRSETNRTSSAAASGR